MSFAQSSVGGGGGGHQLITHFRHILMTVTVV